MMAVRLRVGNVEFVLGSGDRFDKALHRATRLLVFDGAGMEPDDVSEQEIVSWWGPRS